MGSLSGSVHSFSDDCLPREDTYVSRTALVASINSWAAERGYAFIARRSTTSSSGRHIVTYACDKSCKPADPSTQRTRNTTSRGTGCPFSVLAKESLDKSSWVVRHRPNSQHSRHNHAPSFHPVAIELTSIYFWLTALIPIYLVARARATRQRLICLDMSTYMIHTKSTHPSAHPAHRKLDAASEANLGQLVAAGVPPKDIQTYLRQQEPNGMATRQDVYNFIANARRDLRRGQSSIHALVNQLDDEGFWTRVRVDKDERISSILFAHPKSLQYLQSYPDVLLLDCTYKTNKYRMPLLDMIGVDASQRSFCIAFAFLSGEDESEYGWALERLRSLYELCNTQLPSIILTDRCLACMNAVNAVFPLAQSLLCLWHINKAVLRYCQPLFVLQERLAAGAATAAAANELKDSGWDDFYKDWHSIVQSSTEAIFNDRVSQFEQKYLPEHVEEVRYIHSTWLELYKEKFVRAWVDQYTHFGNVVTSRVEGIHALLKAYLKKSTLDLFDAWRSIKHALLNQLSELQANQARQQTRNPIELSSQIYSTIRGWVSYEALRKVETQRKLLNNDTIPCCTGLFKKTQGLPCAHTIQRLISRGQVLRLHHFHSQWHLKRPGSPNPILEPLRVERARPPQSNIPSSSTQREPSAFEIIQPKKVTAQCTRCGKAGHIRASKSCPRRHEEILSRVAAEAAATDVSDVTQDTIIVSQTRTLTSIPHLALPESPERSASVPLPPVEPAPAVSSFSPLIEPQKLSLHYASPEAIYQRYIADRDAWFASQPPGSIKTNQNYRKSKGLPQRHRKVDYDWCLDYKQMGQHCITSSGKIRKWTREEMMAYIDWSEAEDQRIEADVAQEIEHNPQESRRRGVGDIWKQAEKDTEQQQTLHG